MTNAVDESLVAIDALISRHRNVVSLLEQARAALAPAIAAPVRAALPAPEQGGKPKKKSKAKPTAPLKPKDVRDDLVPYDIEGVEVNVLPEQTLVLQMLVEAAAADAYVTSGAVAETVACSVNRAKFLLENLQVNLELAKVPARLNAYKAKGYRLERVEA